MARNPHSIQRPPSRSRPYTLFIAIAALWFPDVGQGLVRRHDLSDERLLELARSFPAVGRVGRLGDGTLIRPTWVLTAGHVASGILSRGAEGAGPFQLQTDNGAIEAEIADAFLFPGFQGPGSGDLALLRLAAPVSGVEPLDLIPEGPIPGERPTDRRVDVGTECVLVGHGEIGRADRSERSDDGRRRAGTNRIHALDGDTVTFFFERPGAGATALEVTPGSGDSGGPALVRVGDAYRVAAVSSAGSPGENGPGTYGALDVFARVSSARDWIDAVLSDRVEPEPMQSLGALTAAARLAAAEQPSGRALLALLDLIDDPTASADDFVATWFPPSDDPGAASRRARSLESMRAGFGGLQLVEILQATRDEVLALLRGRDTEVILGARLDDQGRILAIFDGRP